MVERPRHPKKDIERFMQSAEARGWRFVKGKKYYKGLCSCGMHLHMVHLTPSSRRYLANLAHRCSRLDCW